MSSSMISSERNMSAVEQADVSDLRSKFAEAIRSAEFDAAGETVVYVDPDRNFEVLEYLRHKRGFDMLKDVTGVDYGGGRPIQVVYQLSRLQKR